MTRYQAYLARATAQHGTRFDPPQLAPAFVDAFNSGARVIVERTYPSGTVYRRRGTIGVTTGWRPAFLLMARVTSHGSSDVLATDDHIIGTIPPRRHR